VSDAARAAVPGVPHRVVEAAAQLEQISVGLLRLAGVVRAAAEFDWHGVAATAFRQLVGLDVEPIARAGALMAQAADHLRGHARVLRAAQDDAEVAVQLDRRAALASQQWRSSAPTPGPDPGEALRARSRQVVADARRRVAASGAAAAEALRAVARLAPAEPDPVHRALARAWEQSRELSTGTVESSLALAVLAVRFSPERAVSDPRGYLSDVHDEASTVFGEVRDPGLLLRSALDLDTLQDSPARWVGHALPTAALAAASGGCAVATRSSSLTVRALARVPGRGADQLRASVQGRAVYGRSGLRARDLRATAGPPSRLGTVIGLPRDAAAVGAAMERDARWASAHITPRVARAAARSGAAQVGGEHAVKQVASVRRKLADDLLQPGAASTSAGRAVNDTVRYTVVHTDGDYVSGTLRTVRELRGEGFELAQAKSTWGGSRYQGLNLVWHDPRTGRLFEVQVHSPGSWDATVRTHPDYELYRDQGVDPARKAHLGRRIAAVYAAVARPRGIDQLPRHLQALGVDTLPLATAPTLLSSDPLRTLHRLALAGPVAAGVSTTGRPRSSG
jgi:hypothetical protein